MQEEYTGTEPVICSFLARLPCATFGIAGLLDHLNEIMRTSYTLDDTPSISTHLEACIRLNYDFGTAYGRLRPRWFSTEFPILQATLDMLEAEDQQMRKTALDKRRNLITVPNLRPRRVWDLYSNRVVPMWIIRSDPWAISHSWMEKRRCVDTPINAYEWPVPIPTDSTLERVRVELLNLGAEYVWLDVLCLRQVGRVENEALRKEEWKLDVPTIGNVYHQNQMVVQYFSGLGKPFSIGQGDIRSTRHWLNRAWTLQEISLNRLTAGKADDSPVAPEVDVDHNGSYTTDVEEFFHRLASLQIFAQEVESIFPVLSAMRGRSAVGELDKIVGLAYLLRSSPLPAYDAHQDVEKAWFELLKTMSARYRGDLLFLGPASGAGGQMWAPSWEQDMAESFPSAKGIYLFEEVLYLQKEHVFSHIGYRIDSCLVQGFSVQEFRDDEEPKVRRGQVIIKDSGGTSHYFEVINRLPDLIPEDESYTLVGSQGCEYWIIAWANDTGHLKKISMLRMPLRSDIDKMQQLCLACRRNSTYI